MQQLEVKCPNCGNEETVPGNTLQDGDVSGYVCELCGSTWEIIIVFNRYKQWEELLGDSSNYDTA